MIVDDMTVDPRSRSEKRRSNGAFRSSAHTGRSSFRMSRLVCLPCTPTLQFRHEEDEMRLLLELAGRHCFRARAHREGRAAH